MTRLWEHTSTPPASDFWSVLCRRHHEATQDGFGDFKRNVNGSYFDWHWSWAGWRRQPWSFVAFLLRNTCLREKILAWSPDLYTFVTRLTWQYALKRDRLGVMKLPEPLLGNPRRVMFGQRLISQDLAHTSLEVNYAFQDGPPRSVLEIGAGYGRFAYAVLSLWPDVEYTIVDIFPAQAIARWYLSQTVPVARVRFLTPEAFRLEPDQRYDLGVSISTLPEFPALDAWDYLRALDRQCSRVYLKQWSMWTNPASGMTSTFDSWKSANWRSVRGPETCPVAVKFSNALYDTRPGP